MEILTEFKGASVANDISSAWQALFREDVDRFDRISRKLRGTSEEWRNRAESAEVKNSAYLLGSYVSVLREYNKLWLDLRKEEPEHGWIHLVTAQEEARWLAPQLEDPEYWGIDYLNSQLFAIEDLYPYNCFMSIGFISDEVECSLCGRDPYGLECPHIPSKLYEGKKAFAIHKSLKRLDHVSLTDNPRDKRCVIEAINGEPRNFEKVLSVAENAPSPLHPLNVIETTRQVNPRRYSDRSLSSVCPCGSGNKFGSCCRFKDMMEVPWTHVDIGNRWTPHHLPCV